jgi:hypothetical protein
VSIEESGGKSTFDFVLHSRGEGQIRATLVEFVKITTNVTDELGKKKD